MNIKSQSHTSPVLKHCIVLDEEEDSHGQTGCNFLKKAEYGIHVISTQKSLGKLKIAREFVFSWLAVTRLHIRYVSKSSQNLLQIFFCDVT